MGTEGVREVFTRSANIWHARAEHPHWCGLNLYGVDGVVWRTPDSPKNQATFARTANASGEVAYPQVRMVCLMELSSHLLVNIAFDSVAENEMNWASQLITSILNHSLTLFDRGFYSLGLLQAWQQAQPDSYGVLPLKKGTQYEVVRTLGKHDQWVKLPTTSQARKKWPALPDTLEARLLTKTGKGKPVSIFRSLTDPMRYPSADILDLYNHRWEIELGYREMKQPLLESRFTRRSQLPELVTQALWGVFRAYNLIRYKMLLMAKSLPSIHPNQLSFRDAASYTIFKLTPLPSQTPGNIPRDILDIERNARQFKLEGKRERAYSRVLKMSKNKYPVRAKKNAAHA